MTFLRNRFAGISFRGRLLLLLVAVSLVQATVASITFHNLQSKPLEQKFDAQLNASIRAANPVVRTHVRDASRSLQVLLADDAINRALDSGDYTTADQLIAASLVKSNGGTAPAPAASASTTTPGSPAGAASASLDPEAGSGAATTSSIPFFVTDGTGRVVAGRRPTAPMFDDDSTSAPLSRGAQLVATVHVPVVFDATLLQEIQGYAVKGTTVFAISGHRVSTSSGIEGTDQAKPKVGIGRYKVEGRDSSVLVLPLLDGKLQIGAAVPRKVVVAQQHQSLGSLIGFIAALLILMLTVSFLITNSVGGALQRFAGITQMLASGQLSRRIPVTGKDEIAVLSTSFNEMAEHLERRMQGLVDARVRMRRQVDLFGDALANSTDMHGMLHAVCQLAIESTNATHARFWAIDEEGRYEHAVSIGLRPADTEPCGLERAVTVQGRSVVNDTSPHWMVVPARTSDKIVGLLTLVSTSEAFTADEVKIAERLGVQAAVAIDNARMHEVLRTQATRDGLTGLPNHRAMQDELTRLLDEGYKHGMPVGVTLLDVDNFKSVNDTYGHQIGDDVLKEVAKAMSHSVGGAGFVARYGGEEFVVLMPGCDADASMRIADRVREEIAFGEVTLPDGGTLKVTASFGVVCTDQYGERPENADMFAHADAGLYNAKRTGKNKVALGGPDVRAVEMSDEEKERLAARERGEAAVATPVSGVDAPAAAADEHDNWFDAA